VLTRLVPASYRSVLAVRGLKGLLAAFGVSFLGDAMSAVTIAWLAIEIAPADRVGLLVGAAVAVYLLPGVLGGFALAPWLRHQPARRLVLADSVLRAGFLGAISVFRAVGHLSPALYLVLLSASSLLAAWGQSGKYTLVGELVGADDVLIGNALLSAIGSATIIIGPAIAGVLVALFGAGPLVGADAVSFAVLAIVVWRRPSAQAESESESEVETKQARSGLRLIRDYRLVGLLALTWFFFFLYGSVEVALPLHVAQDLHRGAGLLGLYWALFGVGACIGSLGAGLLRRFPIWPTSLVIAGLWGLCLVPFVANPPVAVTLTCFGLGGLIYGPYVPLSYALMQRLVPVRDQGVVLAARAALMTVSAPLGTVLGGPIAAGLGAGRTLAASGAATVVLVVITALGTRGGGRRRQWTDASP
jgi:MFS family permease